MLDVLPLESKVFVGTGAWLKILRERNLNEAMPYKG